MGAYVRNTTKKCGKNGRDGNSTVRPSLDRPAWVSRAPGEGTPSPKLNHSNGEEGAQPICRWDVYLTHISSVTSDE